MYKVCFVLLFCFYYIPVVAQGEPELVLPVQHRDGQLKDILFTQENVISVGFKEIMFWNRHSGALVKKIGGIETPAVRYIKEICNGNRDKMVLICNDRKGVKTIDLTNGQTISEIVDTSSVFSQAIISADGKLFATASEDTSGDHLVRIWDVKTGGLLQTPGIILNLGYIGNWISFSKDSKKLLLYNKTTVIVWDLDLGKRTGEIVINRDKISDARFNVQASRVKLETGETSVIIWDPNKGKVVKEINVDSITPGESVENSIEADFSPDGKKLLVSYRDTVRIYDTEDGKFLSIVPGYPFTHNAIIMSKDGKQLITTCSDSTAKVWDIETAELIYSLPAGVPWRNVIYASFSPDGRQIVTSGAEKNSWMLWDALTGKLVRHLPAGASGLDFVKFSDDGNAIATSYQLYEAPQVWDRTKYEMRYELKGHANAAYAVALNPFDNTAAIGYINGRVAIYNIETGIVSLNIQAHSRHISDIVFHPFEKQILTTAIDGAAMLWDMNTGELLEKFPQRNSADEYVHAGFSADGKRVITFCYDDTVAKVWDSRSGKLLFSLPALGKSVTQAEFNATGTRIVTSSNDGAKLWNAVTGKLIMTSAGRTVAFTPKGDKLIVNDWHLKIFNAQTGLKMEEWENPDNYSFYEMVLLPDNKSIIALDGNEPVIVNMHTGEITTTLLGKPDRNHTMHMGLSPDGKYIYTTSFYDFKVWDLPSRKLIMSVPLNDIYYSHVSFSQDSKKIVVGRDYAVTVYDIDKNAPLYSIYSFDSTDYLYVDNYNRYDGTEQAIRLLNYSCNMELIGLDQVKEQLWVPRLVETVMKGEQVEAKKLSEMEICGLTPQVTSDETANEFNFNIVPRKGGLGETVLFINNIAISNYDVSHLEKNNKGYLLKLGKDSLKQYFRDDIPNSVTIKAYTTNNDIFARGDDLFFHELVKKKGPVNLYAIIIGVDDYKGTTLDLRYPAKDARDMADVLGRTARKLLNADGKEHVFIYNINTGSTRTHFPDKASIRQVFEMVGKRATANDIVFVFFAGHGVTMNYVSPAQARKQFYFLTADADKNSDYTKTGISMAELSEWMRPRHIKAQKRILIFDACNSGQAINDLVLNIAGTQGSSLGERGDEETSRIRALERLNERSGMFILSATGSNQKAYELGRYSQGVLTYALLKVIKEQPGILEEGKLLSVEKWFSAAERKVIEIISKTNVRQQPQKFTTGGFNIGIVDNDVIEKIALAKEKPLFGSSIFLQRLTTDDEMKFSRELNKALVGLEANDNSIAFIPETESPDAFTLTGTYEFSGAVVVVKVNVRFKKAKYSFEVIGTRKNLAAAALDVAKKACSLAAKIN